MTDNDTVIFAEALEAVMNQRATAKQRRIVDTRLRDDSASVMQYAQQVEMDILLRLSYAHEDLHNDMKRASRRRWSTKGNSLKWLGGAITACLLVGVGVLLALSVSTFRLSLHQPASVAAMPVIRTVSQRDASGLELPPVLPGIVRLASGQAVVRLPSGVELTLLGPLELKVRDAMRVTLEKGRMLANVPRWATGFTVMTQTLEIWDMGTIFGVSMVDGASAVFVFKGSVQVNEANGDSVDLCMAGEGVHIPAHGSSAVKITVDGVDAQRFFKIVRGEAALRNIEATFAATDSIIELWVEENLPRSAQKIRELIAREDVRRRAVLRVPFSKKAWVRPAAPLNNKETNNMKSLHTAALLTSMVMASAQLSVAHSTPVSVDADLHSRHWTTVFESTVPLAWEWPASAVSAALKITGMNSQFATTFTSGETSFLWTPRTPTATAEDDYNITLTFYGAGHEQVGALTSRLAVVTGTFTPTVIDAMPDSGSWNRIKGNPIIPYDAAWAEATVGAAESSLAISKSGGTSQTNTLADTAGYFGWRLSGNEWGYGQFTLALSFPPTEGLWDAELVRFPAGTLLQLK